MPIFQKKMPGGSEFAFPPCIYSYFLLIVIRVLLITSAHGFMSRIYKKEVNFSGVEYFWLNFKRANIT